MKKARIVILNSRNWFNLEQELQDNFDIWEIKDQSTFDMQQILEFGPKFVFVVHWNWKIHLKATRKPKFVIFHTAPLPFGRGGSPIQNLILSGFETAPVCALAMDDQLDAGDIYCKEFIELDGSLSDIFIRISSVINKMIKKLMTSHISPIPQFGEITHFKRRHNNDIPKVESLDLFYNFVRMLDAEDYPKSFIDYGKFRIFFKNSNLVDSSLTAECVIVERSDNDESA